MGRVLTVHPDRKAPYAAGEAENSCNEQRSKEEKELAAEEQLGVKEQLPEACRVPY